jgi:hypothetical protein
MLDTTFQGTIVWDFLVWDNFIKQSHLASVRPPNMILFYFESAEKIFNICFILLTRQQDIFCLMFSTSTYATMILLAT